MSVKEILRKKAMSYLPQATALIRSFIGDYRI